MPDARDVTTNGGAVPTIADEGRIRVEQAAINTVQVTIKTMTVNRRQVTLSLFRQLIDEPLVDPATGEFCGVPWGRINYHGAKDCDDRPHLHVVWQRGEELRRACECKPRRFDPIPEGNAPEDWLVLALDAGWRPETWDSVDRGDRFDEYKVCRVRFTDLGADPGLSCLLSCTPRSYHRLTAFVTGPEPDRAAPGWEWKHWDAGRAEIARRAAEVRDRRDMDLQQLGEEIAAEVHSQHEAWRGAHERWRELEALPQLFIAT